MAVQKTVAAIDSTSNNALIFIVLFGLASLLWIGEQWREANSDPLRILGVSSVTEAPPGGTTTISLVVAKSSKVGQCSVQSDMFVRDSLGGPERYVGQSLTNSVGDRIVLRFSNPAGAASGPATVSILSHQTCNRWHEAFGPLVTEYSQPFMILSYPQP